MVKKRRLSLVAPRLQLTVPLETAVVHLHGAMVTGSRYEPGQGIVVEMDVRRADWRAILKLPAGTQIGFADPRTVDIQELSAMPWALRYRVKLGDGWYRLKDGERKYFGVGQYLTGMDLERGMTDVAIRAGVLLAVLSGVGLRSVCWLLEFLFHLTVSKSALDRQVKECAASLPNAAGMVQALHADKPITRVHMDEIFARGQRPKLCTVVLRDEHGRIFAAWQLVERTAAAVAEFLEVVKSWGIMPAAFHVDGCEAYRDAIRQVFPGAVIQYDYFHVVQNVFKKLWKAMVEHRRELKRRGEASTSPTYSGRLLGLAQQLWENRHLLFTRDENLSGKELATLADICLRDRLVATLRGFQKALTAIFEDSADEKQARERLAALAVRAEVKDGNAFGKSVAFLTERFDDMICYLRHPGIAQRNSLSETGIRFLRRMEQGHDGFRCAAGLDRHLRIFQAVRYLGWSVHRLEGGLALPSV